MVSVLSGEGAVVVAVMVDVRFRYSGIGADEWYLVYHLGHIRLITYMLQEREKGRLGGFVSLYRAQLGVPRDALPVVKLSLPCREGIPMFKFPCRVRDVSEAHYTPERG